MQDVREPGARTPLTGEPQRHLLSADDVCTLLDVDRSTVYRMAADGRLPAVKVGRQWRFPAGVIADLLRTTSPTPSAPAAATREPEEACSLSPEVLRPVLDVAAAALGVMMVATDLAGRPLTPVINPCPRLAARASEAAVLAECLAEWRLLADDVDFEPRFRSGPLGFQCARVMVRRGDRLVAMVLAGGIAPAGQDADDLHSLDDAERARVLTTLPRIAAALSRRDGPPEPTTAHDRRSTP
jgi:excisionase family DNA binding protein